MRSQNFLAERHMALTVLCPSCHMPPGEVCVRVEFGRKVEIEHYAAHWQRTKAAEAAHKARR